MRSASSCNDLKFGMSRLACILVALVAAIVMVIMPTPARAAVTSVDCSWREGSDAIDVWYPDEDAASGLFQLYVRGAYQTEEASALFNAVNVVRAQANLGALQWSDTLSRVAQIRAAEASVTGNANRPSGRTLQDIEWLSTDAIATEGLDFVDSVEACQLHWETGRNESAEGATSEQALEYQRLTSGEYAYAGVGVFKAEGSEILTVCIVLASEEGEAGHYATSGECYQGIFVDPNMVSLSGYLAGPNEMFVGETIEVEPVASINSAYASTIKASYLDAYAVSGESYVLLSQESDASWTLHGWYVGETAIALGQWAGAEDFTSIGSPQSFRIKSFLDVPSGQWYTESIESSAALGLMTGDKDSDTGLLTGLFGPHRQITRAEVVTVLYRIASPESTATSDPSDYVQSSSFPDVQGGRYYTAAIEWCAENGVVTGYKDGTGEFRPNQTINRQELATMVYRFCHYMGADMTVDNPSAFESVYGTGEIASWARDAMRWCASEGIITGVRSGDDLYCMPWDSATRAMGAKVFSMTYVRVSGIGTI